VALEESTKANNFEIIVSSVCVRGGDCVCVHVWCRISGHAQHKTNTHDTAMVVGVTCVYVCVCVCVYVCVYAGVLVYVCVCVRVGLTFLVTSSLLYHTCHVNEFDNSSHINID